MGPTSRSIPHQRRRRSLVAPPHPAHHRHHRCTAVLGRSGSSVERDGGGHPVHGDEWPRLTLEQSVCQEGSHEWELALAGVVQLRASLGWFMGPQLTYRDLSSKPAKRRSESDLQCRRWADARTRWLPVLLRISRENAGALRARNVSAPAPGSFVCRLFSGRSPRSRGSAGPVRCRHGHARRHSARGLLHRRCRFLFRRCPRRQR